MEKHPYDENQIFVMKAGPNNWLDYAEELRNSMDYLWERKTWGVKMEYDDIDGYKEKSYISRTWLLLAGFALENLIKGLIIAQNPPYISNGKLSRKLATHEISNLALSIKDMSLSEDEENLLKILEKCIPSWGRYPIPIHIYELSPEINATDKIKETFETLFDKFYNQIEEIITGKWKGPHGLTLNYSVTNLASGLDTQVLDEVIKHKTQRKTD